MELYDAIFYRKSIRKYVIRNIKDELMTEVKNICKNINYPNKDINIKAHVVEKGHLINILMQKKNNIKAPHYIVVTSNEIEDYSFNVGFAIEEVVLKLTSLGIGTCWLETNLDIDSMREFIEIDEIEFLEDEEIDENELDLKKEKVQIIIAFGYPEESENIFRKDKSKIDRKSLKDICKKIDSQWTDIIEAVRLSPSIDNSQPWIMYKDGGSIHIYSKKKKKNIDELSKMSMGIAIRHFDIACKRFSKNIEYSTKCPKKRLNKDFYVSATLK